MSDTNRKIIDFLVNQWLEKSEDGHELTVEQLLSENSEILPNNIDLEFVITAAGEQILAVQQMDLLIEPILREDHLSRPHARNGEVFGSDRFELQAGTKVSATTELTIESEINRGGLGVIYVAKDKRLRRKLAVKIANDPSDQDTLDRFCHEAKITAQLNHPGIIPLINLGETEGRPCYAMRLIHGNEFSDVIATEHRSTDRSPMKKLKNLLKVFLSVCDTLEYAHNLGVIHCDVKPENIRVGSYGETILLDWGEAVSVGVKVDGPRIHSNRVTVAYTAPELMKPGHIPNVACDIYSLGMVLIHILAGRPDPTAMKKGNRMIPAALAAVARKATAENPKERYVDCSSLSSEIEAWIGNEKVTVYQDSASQWFSRQLRRYETVSQLAIAGVLATILMLIVALRVFALNAHEQAVSQRRSIQFSAALAADRIGDEFRMRFTTLQKLADEILADPVLVEELKSGKTNQLHFWLGERTLDDPYMPTFTSVFVLNAQGVQIAKSTRSTDPRALDSLGQQYAGRTYFTGRSQDLEQDPDPVQIIGCPNVSSWYQSSTSDNIRIALTVPLIGKDNSIVGVIGLSMNVVDLEFVCRRLSDRQLFSLVDTRSGADGSPAGLIACHRAYHKCIREEGRQPDYKHVDEKLLNSLNEVKQRRFVQFQRLSEDQRFGTLNNFVEDYRDPLSKDTQQFWKMSHEPVIVRYGDQLIEVGLSVLIQEK